MLTLAFVRPRLIKRRQHPKRPINIRKVLLRLFRNFLLFQSRITLRSSGRGSLLFHFFMHTRSILVRDVHPLPSGRFRNPLEFGIRFSWSIRTAYLPCRYVGLLPSLQTPLLLLRECGIRRWAGKKRSDGLLMITIWRELTASRNGWWVTKTVQYVPLLPLSFSRTSSFPLFKSRLIAFSFFFFEINLSASSQWCKSSSKNRPTLRYQFVSCSLDGLRGADTKYYNEFKLRSIFLEALIKVRSLVWEPFDGPAHSEEGAGMVSYWSSGLDRLTGAKLGNIWWDQSTS
jgi:hypothetical protein